jgi:hypothetical protein
MIHNCIAAIAHLPIYCDYLRHFTLSALIITIYVLHVTKVIIGLFIASYVIVLCITFLLITI